MQGFSDLSTRRKCTLLSQAAGSALAAPTWQAPRIWLPNKVVGEAAPRASRRVLTPPSSGTGLAGLCVALPVTAPTGQLPVCLLFSGEEMPRWRAAAKVSWPHWSSWLA